MYTFQEFKDGVIGRSLDYDGVAGYQCVDLVKVYLDWCFGIKPGAWGNAKDYWNTLNRPQMNEHFYRVQNTPDLVIQKGDIVVWGAMRGNPYGHVAIGLGEGDVNGFQSLDQNWGTSYVRQVGHNFDGVLGVLRLKDPQEIEPRVEEVIIPEPEVVNYNNEISYRTHVAYTGWLDWVNGGQVSGTTGQELRIEAVQFDFPFRANVKAHIERKGWVEYKDITKDTIIGTVGKSLRLEALIVEPINAEHNLYIWGHVQNFGWQQRQYCDGSMGVGTTNQSLRLEAIQLDYE